MESGPVLQAEQKATGWARATEVLVVQAGPALQTGKELPGV